ncbi:DUF6171 family protein [Shouchella miscanthi]|uniref:DUF6171 family protein n=1 Tax=Shouchella miscanthi TaxID=2598861 RepID=UPI0011A1E6A4|nr:DUF6171 family protein [Shouchella miscanthi]
MSCHRCPEKLGKSEIQQQIAEQLALETNLVSEEVAVSRLAICESCEQLIDDNTCGLCGCYIHFRARLAAKNCPANKSW